MRGTHPPLVHITTSRCRVLGVCTHSCAPAVPIHNVHAGAGAATSDAHETARLESMLCCLHLHSCALAWVCDQEAEEAWEGLRARLAQLREAEAAQGAVVVRAAAAWEREQAELSDYLNSVEELASGQHAQHSKGSSSNGHINGKAATNGADGGGASGNGARGSPGWPSAAVAVSAGAGAGGMVPKGLASGGLALVPELVSSGLRPVCDRCRQEVDWDRFRSNVEQMQVRGWGDIIVIPTAYCMQCRCCTRCCCPAEGTH